MIIAESAVDAETAAWMRGPADEAAVRNGCRFDVLSGAYTVWWIENICRLYEGDQAGEPMVLRGCAECDYELPTLFDWDGEYNGFTGQDICIERAARHVECVAAGHQIDWQYDCTMRVFGWVRWSDHWQQEIRRFRKAMVFISKKNKKSPTLSAWGHYLLSGDGEPGQHVYLGAKDGEQARSNTGAHAVEMMAQSPELSDECTLNKNLMQITHEPSRSTMKPLSSSNVRTQKSKEGLNGSVLVDEVHVVDREFINRISRAGISRRQPLFAEFSTAGDDPDSYGMEEFKRGEQILKGEIEDQEQFVAIYAAPQDLSDADLDADPLKYGRMANPAFGHTVNPEEFLADYKASRESLGNLALFKMYRLNIWQNAASPWLSLAGWDKGKRDFTRESLEGRGCYGGLDLATVCDFTTLCLAFPEDKERMKYLWWFWLPEETARKIQHLVAIRDWEKDPRCKLMLTPGARIDFSYIRNTIRELHGRYKIEELAYDDWNAEQTTQEVSEGVRDAAGTVVEKPTGIPRVDFSQSIKSMNEPSKRFEASVIDGTVEHNGDPIARWMAQNATIKPDCNGNYKPLKPKDGTKKIDAIVAAIMARARASMGYTGSVYATRGLLEIGAEAEHATEEHYSDDINDAWI